jgi:hypothetical protein
MKKHEIVEGVFYNYDGSPSIMSKQMIINYHTHPSDQRKCSGLRIQSEHLDACLDLTLTEKDTHPVYFNGDNIMVFITTEKDGFVNCRLFLHSEVDGSVFYVNRIKYLHEFQLMYASIEGVMPEFKENSIV